MKRFWEPLILATMNTPPQQASAELFLQVLKRAVLSGGSQSALIFPASHLSELIAPFGKLLEEKGSRLRANSHVKKIVFSDSLAAGVELAGMERIDTDAVISALPPYALGRVLPDMLLKNEFSFLEKFSYSPIVSVYIWLDREICDMDFAALLGTRSQWVFNKNIIGAAVAAKQYPGFVTITISAANEIVNMQSSDIAKLCLHELKTVLPKAVDAAMISHKVIKTRKATILTTPETDSIRPDITTSVPNLFIAGDWTSTKLPATLEGAAQSGFEAAEKCAAYLFRKKI
jgi:zeta-carotene desaturase